MIDVNDILKNEVVMDTLNGLSFGTVLAWVFFIVASLGVLIGLGVKVFKWIEKYRKSRNNIDLKNKEFEIIKEEISKMDKSIGSIMIAVKEISADRINEKYKYYLHIKCIPEDEFDEFCNLHNAYKGVGGNSTIDAKFDKAIEELPVREYHEE